MWIVGRGRDPKPLPERRLGSDDGVAWECVTDDVPCDPRVLYYTVTYDGKIRAVRGHTTLPQFAPAEEIFYSDVWNSEDWVDWTGVADRLPCGPRGMIGGSAVHQQRIWILGGGIYDTPQRPRRAFYNDVWSSPDGIRWQRHLEQARGGRGIKTIWPCSTAGSG